MPNNDSLLVLDKHHVDAVLDADATLAAVREAFVLHSRALGRVYPVVREALHTGGVFGIKSGEVATQSLLGFKAAGFWPANRAQGGEPHQATIMLFDPATGRPTCLMDGNAVTTMRTGAAGALGLGLFARPDSRTLCVFGSGVQARIHVTFALRTLPALERVFYLTYNGQPDPAFEAAFAGGLAPVHRSDADAAVADSDVVITATPGAGALFSAAAIRPGTHINSVGTDTKGKRELPPHLLEGAQVFVDDLTQSRQIGELQWLPGNLPATEIGAVLDAAAPFARQAGAITVFDLTGLALQDLTVGRMIHQRAQEQGLGHAIPWPWRA
jgi:alanine dehydrogenase